MLQTTYDIITRQRLNISIVFIREDIPSIEFTEKAGSRYRNLMWNHFIRGPMFVDYQKFVGLFGSLGRDFVSNWFVALQYVR